MTGCMVLDSRYKIVCHCGHTFSQDDVFDILAAVPIGTQIVTLKMICWRTLDKLFCNVLHVVHVKCDMIAVTQTMQS